MPQLSLFDAGQTHSVAQLDAAPIPADVRTLATKLPRALRLGTMSWTYPGWIGPLYGAAVREKQLLNRGLTAFTQHPLLRCVEFDRTYYEPLAAATYAQFAAQTPDDFRFVAKAHEDCTAVHFPQHPRYGAKAGLPNPRLLDVAYATDFVIGPYVEGLGKKAGALVFQFSPFEVRSPERFAERLHDFLRQLPKGPVYAVELRNIELLTGKYGSALVDTGTMHCHNAWGRMPSVLAQRALLPPQTRKVLIARWLTRPNDTHESARERFFPFNALVEEDLPRRDEIAELTSSALSEGSDAFVLISNKAEGCAPESVLRLAQSITDLEKAIF